MPWEPDVHLCYVCQETETLRVKVNSEHSPEAIRGWKIRLVKGGVDGE